MKMFEEIDHTADWALRVNGENLTALLHNAASGMFHLMGLRITKEKSSQRHIEIEARDSEELLVTFLEELLYAIESRSVGFDEMAIQIVQSEGSGPKLKLLATLIEAPISSLEKSIKAVTYHGLEIRPIDNGFQAVVVFDV
jgi:SHS2 domain-containing protein